MTCAGKMRAQATQQSQGKPPRVALRAAKKYARLIGRAPTLRSLSEVHHFVHALHQWCCIAQAPFA